MYVLRGRIGQRGFYLERNGALVFKTHHRFGVMPSSRVVLGDDIIKITLQNILGDRCNIINTGVPI